MKQIPYTRQQFDDAYFHMGANNRPFSRRIFTGLPSEEKTMYRSLWSDDQDDIERIKGKLGASLTEPEDGYNHFWFFELDGDVFYYSLHEKEGQSFAVYIKPRDKSKNWLFEPEEYDNSESQELCDKLLKFVRELNGILQEA